MKRLASAFPWIDVLAAVPFVVLVLLSADPLQAMARIDPFIVFRLLMFVWLLSHVIILLRRFVADVVSIRELLRDVENRYVETVGVAAIGDRVLKFTAWRLVGLAVRHGWPTLLMAGVVATLNLAAWLVMTGRLAELR